MLTNFWLLRDLQSMVAAGIKIPNIIGDLDMSPGKRHINLYFMGNRKWIG